MDSAVNRKVESFFKKYSKKAFSKGDLIVTPEKIPDGVYCLTKGIGGCLLPKEY